MSKSWIDVYSLHPIITCPHIVFVFRLSWTCHQLKNFVAKMVGFENRTAKYIKAYLRNGSAENRHFQSKSR